MSTTSSPLPRWIYRIGLFALLVAALKANQFTFDEYHNLGPGFFETSGTDFRLLWASMSSTLWLLGAVAAMAARSGAVIWILSLYLIIDILPLFSSIFQAMPAGPALMIAIIMSLPLIAIGYTLRYLVKTGELRKP